MTKLNLRAAGALALCVGWASACGGSSFNAAGGGGAAGSGSSSGGSGAVGGGATGGSSNQAGSGQSGDVGLAGTTAAGGAQGGGAQGGSAPGGSSGSAGVAGTGGVGGTGGTAVRNSGDCDVDKDCGAGNKCVALSLAGFRTCVVPVPPPTTCGSMSDQCCPSDPAAKQCAAGSNCVAAPVAPSCGLVMVAANVCVTPQCAANSDCSGSNAICVPAGALSRKNATCLTGGCRRDTDCKDIAGGKCEPVTGNCCDGPSGLYCVYPGKGCRSSKDCAAGSTCQITNQKVGECVAGAGVCAF